MSNAIARALAWEPDERQQSAAELGREIELDGRSGEDEQTPFRPSPTDAASSTARRGWSWKTPALVGGAVLVALAVGWLARRTPPPSPPPDGPAVVAVLPLENVSGDPEIDHVGVGIAHTLITKLSALPSITMVSRTAEREYEAAGQDTRALARDLGATFVVKGSVQRVAERLHINANLVRSDDSIAWGGEFEGNMSDLFELQRRLAAGLTEALHLNLTPQQKRRLDAPPTGNVNAYAEYSQGRYFLERSQETENLERGIHLLESAVERDGNFALAWAALGEAYWEQFEKTTDRVWTDKARDSAERARRLDPDHPSVHYVLAVIYNGTGERDRATDELRRALALQPNYDDAYRLMGEIVAARGDVDVAAREFRQAIAIRPNFWGHHHALGLAYFRAGRLAEAAEAFRRVTELRPDLATGFQALGAVYHTMGDLDRAVPIYVKSIALNPNAGSLNNLGTIYYRQGKFAEAAHSYEQALEIQPNRAVTHRNLGDAYQRLGETAKSRAAFQKSAELNRNLLEVNPKDGTAMALLALLEAKMGKFEEATGLAEKAAGLAPANAQVLYHKAVVEALAGRSSEAIASLRVAIQNGYAVSEIREDDDLDSLRNIPEFQALLATSHD